MREIIKIGRLRCRLELLHSSKSGKRYRVFQEEVFGNTPKVLWTWGDEDVRVALDDMLKVYIWEDIINSMCERTDGQTPCDYGECDKCNRQALDDLYDYTLKRYKLI